MMLLSLTLAFPALAAGDQASVTTVPSPAVTTKALEVKIQTSDLGSEVYCYTWCSKLDGSEKNPFTWDGVLTDKFKMSGSGGTYTLTISNIQEFYGLTDSQLEKLTELGFIARAKNGRQTEDKFVSVEQGRRDVYAGGEGTMASPYILETPAHLAEFSTSSRDWAPDVYVKLGKDISASDVTSPIGTLSNPYQGHFDGAGHTISGLSITADALGSSAALFGAIRGAEIKDLGVTDASVSGVNHVGILAGMAESGTISRCFATGTVAGKSICVGGLVGENAGATISDCYTGVDVTNDSDYATGGVAGKNTGKISNVYAAGSISGFDYVGGIVGANYGKISNSVALNTKVGSASDYVARFGGNGNSQNEASACHSWDGIASAAEWKDFGHHGSVSSNGVLLDFSQFKTLTGWDFDNVWEWKGEAEKPYPALRGLANQNSVLPAEFYNTSGVEEIFEADKATITAGPNPFTDRITVSSTVALLSVEVYSTGGVRMASAAGNGRCELTIELGNANAGIYILQAVAENGSRSSFKLIKK